MTRAAYEEAIEWAAARQVPLGLECDVHFAADDELICLHDLTLDRMSPASGPAFDRTVAELRRIDFGGSTLVTLAELMAMVAAAGPPVSLVIETKHPNPRGLDVEARVARLLRAQGWDRAGGPVQVISFNVPAIERLGRLLPDVPRTFLIEKDFGPWRDGHLPDGVTCVGPDLELLRADPGYVDRAHAHGNDVHVWTVNDPADVEFCLSLGVDSLTTDDPEAVFAVISGSRPYPSGRRPPLS